MNILIVEDDPGLCEVLAILCQREGHRGVSAHDGREALARLAEQPFAMLIVDAHMPHLDGMGFIRQVRRQSGFEHLPIVGMTAGSEYQDQRALRDAGADRIIKKPFHAGEVRQIIREVLAPP